MFWLKPFGQSNVFFSCLCHAFRKRRNASQRLSYGLQDAVDGLWRHRAAICKLELAWQGCLGGWLALGMFWLVEVGRVGVGCAWPVWDICISKSQLKSKQIVKYCKCISQSFPLAGEKQMSNRLILAGSSSKGPFRCPLKYVFPTRSY